MMTLVRSWSLRFVAASLVLATVPVSAEDAEGVVRLGQSESAGVVRVSDQSQPEWTYRGQSGEIQQVSACKTCPTSDGYASDGYVTDGYVTDGYVSDGYVTDGYATCEPGPYLCANSKVGQWISMNMFFLGLRNQQRCNTLKASCRADIAEKKAYLRCKFGYFCPTGPDGKGAPPWGKYSMVYPVNPDYFDSRDGQVYAAPGYGGPVSVPLAPNVNHTYNYGWGIPSSRLTPVAHPLTPGVPTP
ncbi:hypothetical protein [Thalassoglobus sp.]|uniref:hypothetical protein n=1 Tax=Thalassoglobus sp. TaxID=2795869 RepID=UPI003AA7E820